MNPASKSAAERSITGGGMRDILQVLEVRTNVVVDTLKER